MSCGAERIVWYSGASLYEQPRRLCWGGRWLTVLAVSSRGITPNGAFLKILASDQRCYRLDYDQSHDLWQILPWG
ncbi:MAG: hypothetical protein ACUVRZ_06795 [Desulfobacca sp.]|uniref:hypothetical protein n=1 Tax=Desulfobacca sp. TaxID=2067990 RepID=UPI00404B030D